jgi:CheY-like chemotaxis protein
MNFWQSETRTILAAEDDESTRMVVEMAFRKASTKSQLRFVEDGIEAVSYLQGEANFADRNAFPFPSILLLDLKMPRMDGFELLEWVRLEKRINDLVIIVFSSSEEQADIDRAFSLGANSYLVKSSLYDELIEVLKGLEHYWTKHNRLPSSCEKMFTAR